MATVRETGEFGLLARLAATVAGADSWPGRVRGIGDDAAIWRQPPAGMVATADMLVEGVHFDLALTGWRDLGWKALAVNLSDVAAMGAAPLLALISLGLPADTPLAHVDDLYDGLRDLAAQSACAIAGGDTVSVQRDVVISVA
ncbi:MAG TPA: AIR synthase related protein, partial [Chloroflexota bacterium]|nr:AIR synthase related protein [Chloroflexota bacterium]